MRVILCIMLVLWSAGALAQGTAYRWVDDQGVVHFSDRPREGAEEIQLGRPPGFSPPALPAAPPAVAPAEPAAAVRDYDRLEFLQPGEEETLWNIGGILNVAVRIEPRLRPGHRLEFFYDGARVEGLPPDARSFQLEEVWRGEHTLEARVVDERGAIITRSPLRTFFVQQTSIQNPQRRGAPP